MSFYETFLNVCVGVTLFSLVCLAFAALFSTATLGVYYFQSKKIPEYRTIADLEEGLSWSKWFQPVYNAAGLKTIFTTYSIFALLASLPILMAWKWLVTAMLVSVLVGLICAAYRVVNAPFKAWSDCRELLTSVKNMEFEPSHEARIVRSLQGELL